MLEKKYGSVNININTGEISEIKLNQMKIKEEELKLIKEQQKNLSKLVNEIGLIETQKHGLLHQIAVVNKDIRDYKEVLENEAMDL